MDIIRPPMAKRKKIYNTWHYLAAFILMAVAAFITIAPIYIVMHFILKYW